MLQPETLPGALEGCEAAYYLIHSMGSAESFRDADRVAATNFAEAAAMAGVGRIIYLGGLAEAKDGALSKHLRSRIEVADILQAGPVPTTDLRTPMILGSGIDCAASNRRPDE